MAFPRDAIDWSPMRVIRDLWTSDNLLISVWISHRNFWSWLPPVAFVEQLASVGISSSWGASSLGQRSGMQGTQTWRHIVGGRYKLLGVYQIFIVRFN